MGVFEFLFLTIAVVLLAALAIWVIGYFSPSPVPAIIPKIIWGVVILVLLYVLANAVGLFGHDVQIPRLR